MLKRCHGANQRGWHDDHCRLLGKHAVIGRAYDMPGFGDHGRCWRGVPDEPGELRSCLQGDDKLPDGVSKSCSWSRFGQHSPLVARHWPLSAKLDQHVGQVSTDIGRVWPHLAKLGQTLAKPPQFGQSGLARCSPSLAHAAQNWTKTDLVAKIGRLFAKTGRLLVNLGQSWSNLGRSCRLLKAFRTILE